MTDRGVFGRQWSLQPGTTGSLAQDRQPQRPLERTSTVPPVRSELGGLPQRSQEQAHHEQAPAWEGQEPGPDVRDHRGIVHTPFSRSLARADALARAAGQARAHAQGQAQASLFERAARATRPIGLTPEQASDINARLANSRVAPHTDRADDGRFAIFGRMLMRFHMSVSGHPQLQPYLYRGRIMYQLAGMDESVGEFRAYLAIRPDFEQAALMVYQPNVPSRPAYASECSIVDRSEPITDRLTRYSMARPHASGR